MKNRDNYPVKKTDTEWREQLSANEYKILREKGTEYPFTGLYNNHFDKGTYVCKGCDALLYDSKINLIVPAAGQATIKQFLEQLHT